MNGDKSVIDYILNNGIEKTRCIVIDAKGIAFRISNFVCDNKVYFVVFANSKVVECVEFETE